MKYKNKSEAVDAEQWFEVVYDREAGTNTAPVYHLDVGYYRTPDLDAEYTCKHCQYTMHDHGWMDTPDGGQVVCPGDWIVTVEGGGKCPYKDETFRMTYGLAEEKVDPVDPFVELQNYGAVLTEGGGNSEMKFKPCDGDENFIGVSNDPCAIQRELEGGRFTKCPQCSSGLRKELTSDYKPKVMGIVERVECVNEGCDYWFAVQIIKNEMGVKLEVIDRSSY